MISSGLTPFTGGRFPIPEADDGHRGGGGGVGALMLQRVLVPVPTPLVSGREVLDPARRLLASSGEFAILLSLLLA